MRQLSSVEELQNVRRELSGSVGFVPTMGALHEGHLSLIKKARAENDHVIVSVFVNPTQFLAGEDLSTYPRKPEADMKLCQAAGVDLLFMPNPEVMYGHDEPFVHASPIGGYVLEGARRPGHFNGVLTVVLKLLNLTGADKAYFGKKDAQQLIMIEKMVKRFFLPVEIVGGETIRAKDGLALSSRNVYLSGEERAEALKISESLRVAGMLVSKKELNAETITARMREVLAPHEPEYIAVTDRELFPLKELQVGNSLISLAVRIGTTRLIDNIWI